MDKGQLSVAVKLENPQSIATIAAANDACNSNKDDVALIKKEKPHQMSEVIDHQSTASPQSIIATTLHHKSTSRGKEGNEKKTEIKSIAEFQPNAEELLGSVTTSNSHGTRTSARVIQKMRQDQQTRPVTPPPAERDASRKEERITTQKTPSQARANRPTWTNIERNHFFDALNEFGKDFEAIGNFVNSKLKRRSPALDISFKTKEQVRLHYYQIYHKICKYIRFSDEVRKPVQECYALINYGEMRRKLQFVTDKHFMKLKNLIYHGHITVRCKGKNIRIKTPSCKALRRINQLDDSLEDIRLPSKIEVIISPLNMEAFGRVQTIAQNPRCRTTVPLHKKLINFIKTFEYKWRSMDVRVAEEAKQINLQDHLATPSPSTAALNELTIQDPEICFLPKPGVTIHRPLLSITEYLSSSNICLTAYEERMGVKVKGEFLNADRCTANTSSSSSSIAASTTNKRVRTESGSEKRSPEQVKRLKNLDNSYETMDEVSHAISDNDSSFHIPKNESSGDELSDEIQELLSDSIEMNTSKEDFIQQEKHPPPLPMPPNAVPPLNFTGTAPTTSEQITNPSCLSHLSTQTAGAGRSNKRALSSKTSRGAGVFKPLLNDDIIQSIRSGWTASKAGDITIGDLYVVFGHDSKLELDYYWMPDKKKGNFTKKSKSLSSFSSNTPASNTTPTSFTVKIESQNSSIPLESTLIVKQNVTSTGFKHNSHCSSNTTTTNSNCDEHNFLNSPNSSSSILSNKLKQLLLIANLSERMRKRHQCNCERNPAGKIKFERDSTGRTFIANKPCANYGPATSTVVTTDNSSSVFRQPMIPVRRTSIDPVKQLTTLTRQKMSRQVLVQRLLLPSNNGSVNSTSLSNTTTQSITPDTTTTTSITSTMEKSMKKEVPWKQVKEEKEEEKYKPHTITATTTTTSTTTTTTTTSSSSSSSPKNPLSQDLETCNTTFLNSLNIKDFEELPLNMEPPQTSSHYQQQQQYRDIMEQSSQDKTDGPSSVLSADSAFDECSNTSFLNGLTNMNLIRETSSNSRWLEENINDFSLTSLLGHLDEINSSRDILDPSSNLSVISESSVDYMHKFQEIKALLQSQEKD